MLERLVFEAIADILDGVICSVIEYVPVFYLVSPTLSSCDQFSPVTKHVWKEPEIIQIICNLLIYHFSHSFLIEICLTKYQKFVFYKKESVLNYMLITGSLPNNSRNKVRSAAFLSYQKQWRVLDHNTGIYFLKD